MEDLFIKDIPGIHTRIKVLEEMIKNRCEEILTHLECNQIVSIKNYFRMKLVLVLVNIIFLCYYKV